MGSWKVLSAKGDWHSKVPKGFVAVHLGLGGRLPNGRYPEKQVVIIVSKDEYHSVPIGVFEVDDEDLKSYKIMSMNDYDRS